MAETSGPSLTANLQVAVVHVSGSSKGIATNADVCFAGMAGIRNKGRSLGSANGPQSLSVGRASIAQAQTTLKRKVQRGSSRHSVTPAKKTTGRARQSSNENLCFRREPVFPSNEPVVDLASEKLVSCSNAEHFRTGSLSARLSLGPHAERTEKNGGSLSSLRTEDSCLAGISSAERRDHLQIGG